MDNQFTFLLEAYKSLVETNDISQNNIISKKEFEKLLENEDLLFENYPIIKKDFFSKFNNIIIYTQEKVGSTSLWESLVLALPEYSLQHIHNSEILRRKGIKDLSMYHINEIYKKKSNYNVLYIDIYRPIFDIIVSCFFNDLSIHFQSEKINLKNKDNLIKRFNDLFIYNYQAFSKDYFKNVYGIKDIINFDFDNKHLYKKMNNISFLKLRLIDCNIWPKILQKYTIINRKIPILHTNSTNNKSVKELYNYFKTNYKIPNNYYEIIKEDLNFKFYYDKNEQENYLSQFKEKITENYIPFNEIQLKTYITITEENETFSFSKYMDIIKSNVRIIPICSCSKCVIQKKILYDYCYNKKLTKDDYNEIKDILSKISNIYT